MENLKRENFDIIDSTNEEAKRRFKNIQPKDFFKLHKTLIVAKEQTHGRGRLSRKFYSPQNTGVYFSLIFAPNNELESLHQIPFYDVLSNPGLITATAAVAVCNAIKTIFNLETKIKWVNDVYLEEKKICGILTEGIVNTQTNKIGAAIIGIGINVLPNKNLPKELENKIGSILQITPQEQSAFNEKLDFQKQTTILNLEQKKYSLIETTIQNLLEMLENMQKNKLETQKIINQYKQRSNLLGKTISISPIIESSEKIYTCVATDITEDAKLVVQLSDGTKKILESGEVTLQRP